MDENAKYYRAFGLEPPEEETEEWEPDTEEEDGAPEGENEQETAEPADEEDGEDDAEEPEDDGEDDGEEEPEPPQQSREERARNAERRRQQERDDAIRQALAEQRKRDDEELKEIFAWAGFKDGTKPIETMEQLREYRQRAMGEQLQKDLKDGKLTPEALQGLVRQEIQGMVQTRQQPDREERARAFQQQVQAELEEIRKYDPDIKTVEDFRNLDRAEAFFAEVRDHGHSFADAYKYVYADRIAADAARKAAAASAQRTRNAERSKAHMKPTSGKGAGDIPVPDKVKANIRRLMPDATDEEIRKAYQRYYKK